MFGHVDCVLDISVRERWAGELLRVAAGAGCMPILKRMVTRAQHNTEMKKELVRGLSSGKPQQNALRVAVQGGDLDLISFGE